MRGFQLVGTAAGLRAAAAGALTGFLLRAWPSYLLVALIQAKVLWNSWIYRDLTSGDTSYYFLLGAYPWYDKLADNIVWSPVYTSFYGSVLMLTGGQVYAATILHRIIIVMVATLGVLAVARRLLPPAIALLIALWWAVLPINFDTLYEVHLFALLPILAAWLLATSDTVWRRGAALAMLLVATVLSRNELIVASFIYGIGCLIQEIVARKRGLVSGERAWEHYAVIYGIPLLVALAACLFFYWRSDTPYSVTKAMAEEKHTLNMCQVYAFGYQQRHPWPLNPWTECQPLMQATFGDSLPTLRQMIQSNPSAVWEHFKWNLSLIPFGLQVALFDRMSGTINPDYSPVTSSPSALYLSLATLALVGTAAAIALREGERWRGWLLQRADAWSVMFAICCVAGPIILTQRPRPSYLFADTIIIMLVIGTALHVLVQRWRLESPLRVTATLGGLLLLVMIPPYYPRHASGRPIHDNFEILEPFAPSLRKIDDRIVLGDYSTELANYSRFPKGSSLDYGVLVDWNRQEELSDFLDRRGINVAYFQPRTMAGLLNELHARQLLLQPESQCWQRLGQGRTQSGEWLLIRRDRTRAECAAGFKP